ncbi:hypothetical protein Tco_0600354 [Tanacetum coccineum]|uniref:Transposase (putative) gypsy type domain-containing protein n=1 Tax=Tanacetum coccineum TaxID=301880 RepID=A0ABQ4WBL3_9ASTR
MSAKNALAIQRCELSRKELDEFLSFYPIPSEYRVILPTSTQIILDAPLGYISLYTHCFSLANLRLPLNDFFCEVLQYFKVHISRLNPFGCSKLTTFIVMCKAYDCEPSVELFRGFFNLCKAGSWLTFQKRSEKHIPSLLAKVITRIEGWHQCFFFIQDTIVPFKFPQLLLKENMLDVKSFKDKLPSGIEQNPQFQCLGRYPASARAFDDPILFSGWPPVFMGTWTTTTCNLCGRKGNFIYTEDDEDLTFLPKDFSPGFNTGSVSVSINTEPVRTDEEPVVEPATEPVNEREEILASGSSTSRTVRAKASAIKDDTPVLSIYDDDEGLEDCLELKDATACHLKISAITPPPWKGFLDNHPDVDLLDLHDHCYARQPVVDNTVNRRSRELLKVIEKLKAAMIDFDKNPAVLLLRDKMSSLAAEEKEHKGNLDRLMLES